MEILSTASAPSVRHVINQLTQDGYLNGEERERSTTWLTQQATETATPWFVKLFVGFSAWLAAFFIILFLSVANLIDSGGAMLLIGALFCGAALALKWFARRSIFVGQLAFAASLAGQGLLIVGVGTQTDSTTAAAVAALLLEAVLFVAYPDTVHRLLSIVVMVIALLVLLVEREAPNAIHLFIVLLEAAAIFLWRNEMPPRASKLMRDYWSPAAYGTLLALFGLCVLPLIGDFGGQYWWISAVSLALGLLYLWSQLMSELEIPRQSPVALWLLLGIALLLIPTYETPGILAALLGLMLAFWRRNRLQMGFSAAFLLFFIGVYYYNLDFTLLVKSYILMGTGLALLVVRFGLARTQRRKESP